MSDAKSFDSSTMPAQRERDELGIDIKPNPKSAWLHNLDAATKEEFKSLAYALRRAADTKATGYIVTPFDEIINIRKGKRLGIGGKRWVPCA